MDTKTKTHGLSWFQVHTILIECIDAFLVICGVVVIGMIGLYYNVFRIEIQDIFSLNGGPGVVITAQRQASVAATSESHQLLGDISDEDEALLTMLGEKKKRGGQQLFEYSLDDYLSNSLASYELPFSTIPPGRFISIPSLGVQAPIISVPYAAEEKIENGDFDKELEDGVVQYPFMSDPGKPGNTMIFGHSSVDTFQAKENPFGYIFYKLPKMKQGDLIQVVRDGKMYEYEVAHKKIKRPQDVPDIVNRKTVGDMLTLMACYPLMSDAQRILIEAIPRTKKPGSTQGALLAYKE